MPSFKSAIILLFSLLLSFLRNIGFALFGSALGRKNVVADINPEPAPRDIDVNEFLGKSRSYVKDALGLRYTSYRLPDCYCAKWEDRIPAVTAYFQGGKCARMDTDFTWHLRAKDEAALLAQFSDHERFIGMAIGKIEEIAGTCSNYGSFDFGDEVYEWRQQNVCVSVWCNGGTCRGVEISK